VAELKGIISKQPISILIDPGSNLRYISPQVVEMCALQKRKHAKSWSDQLATRTKRKVSEIIEACLFEMNGLHAQEALNLLPLGSYDTLICMDWSDSPKVKLDCFNKTLGCEDDNGNKRVLQGI